ncbi:MAG: acyltransferase, partial [Gammaproteobacteria bacterium]|nr:acyltransferase [Gammaproteobacteria bacterium]
RAVSIGAVVLGHWLVAAPSVVNGEIVGNHLLGIEPWTQWLTWGFQVMPLFFLVGGFSNGVSWDATLRNGGSYSTWLIGRLQRLINPVMPLFLVWVVFAGFAHAMGVSVGTVKLASQLALVPVWFLAVYLLVVALVPLTWAAWQRLGMGSFWLLAAAVVVVDALVFVVGFGSASFANFVFVWVAVHQLGYAWYEGRFARQQQCLIWCVAGLVCLALAVRFGPYPVAMIGVPGEEVSNSMPPTVALLLLGVFQAGLALLLEPVGRRFLDGVRAWTTVVLVNGMIMTVYLWHLTAFIAAVALAYAAGGIGLGVEPASGAWWAWRPVWIVLYAVVVLPFIVIFARFEQAGTKLIATEVSSWRLVASVVLVCGGLALTAAGGIGSEGWTGVRLWVVALPFIGAALVDFGPLARSRSTDSGT